MLDLLVTGVATISAPIIVGISAFVWRNRKKAIKNRQKVETIEQRLFGLDSDDTDQGALMRMQKQMSMIESKLDHISQKIDENNGSSRYRDHNFEDFDNSFDSEEYEND